MTQLQVPKSNRLGQILCEKGIITEEDLRAALAEQQVSRKPLGAILVTRGFTTEELVARAVAEQLRLPFLEEPLEAVAEEAVRLVPESLARRLAAIPIKLLEDGALMVAMAEPMDMIGLEDLGYASRHRIAPCASTRERILAAIESCYGATDTISGLIDGIDVDQVEVVGKQAAPPEVVQATSVDAPIAKLVSLLILEAVRQRATDVHIEPGPKLMRVRYRVDGILREIMSPPKRMHAAVCTRVKVLASLDIAEHRLPQDGRALVRTRDGSEIDMRVNIVPTIHGEKIELRLLKQDLTGLCIERLGMSGATRARFLELIHRPNGMVLVVGPTGSGKTTTLYAALKQLNDSTLHIITIEDPVEYRIDNINQIQVNAKTGLTFAEGLRSILRQDPNVILVGEIRDRETAEIAIEAAMTGHLVFTTAHSTDAAHAVARLSGLGIDPFLAGTALSGILSTRLVRRLCLDCRVPHEPEAAVAAQLGVSGEATLYKPGGCDKCRQTGYLGRQGIFELMSVDRRIKELLQARPSVTELQSSLARLGAGTLWTDGAGKVAAGAIPFEELLRVTRNYAAEPASPGTQTASSGAR